MAIIRFTEADKLAGKILEKGAYSAVISKINGPMASASKKSVTYETSFQLTKAPYAGKELDIFFNSETSANGMLGTRQYCPHSKLLNVKAAVQNVLFDQVNLDIDTDELINQPLDIIVDIVTSEGNLMNIITGFVPTGKGAAATSGPF